MRRLGPAPKDAEQSKDVFSLGVMAYEMLTMRLPYSGASLFDIGMRQVEGKVDFTGVEPRVAEAIGRATLRGEK